MALDRIIEVFDSEDIGQQVGVGGWPFLPSGAYNVRLVKDAARGDASVEVDVFAGDSSEPVAAGAVALALAAGTRVNIQDSAYALAQAVSWQHPGQGDEGFTALWDPEDFLGLGAAGKVILPDTDERFTVVLSGDTNSPNATLAALALGALVTNDPPRWSRRNPPPASFLSSSIKVEAADVRADSPQILAAVKAIAATPANYYQQQLHSVVSTSPYADAIEAGTFISYAPDDPPAAGSQVGLTGGVPVGLNTQGTNHYFVSNGDRIVMGGGWGTKLGRFRGMLKQLRIYAWVNRETGDYYFYSATYFASASLSLVPDSVNPRTLVFSTDVTVPFSFDKYVGATGNQQTHETVQLPFKAGDAFPVWLPWITVATADASLTPPYETPSAFLDMEFTPAASALKLPSLNTYRRNNSSNAPFSDYSRTLETRLGISAAEYTGLGLQLRRAMRARMDSIEAARAADAVRVVAVALSEPSSEFRRRAIEPLSVNPARTLSSVSQVHAQPLAYPFSIDAPTEIAARVWTGASDHELGVRYARSTANRALPVGMWAQDLNSQRIMDGYLYAGPLFYPSTRRYVTSIVNVGSTVAFVLQKGGLFGDLAALTDITVAFEAPSLGFTGAQVAIADPAETISAPGGPFIGGDPPVAATSDRAIFPRFEGLSNGARRSIRRAYAVVLVPSQIEPLPTQRTLTLALPLVANVASGTTVAVVEVIAEAIGASDHVWADITDVDSDELTADVGYRVGTEIESGQIVSNEQVLTARVAADSPVIEGRFMRDPDGRIWEIFEVDKPRRATWTIRAKRTQVRLPTPSPYEFRPNFVPRRQRRPRS